MTQVLRRASRDLDHSWAAECSREGMPRDGVDSLRYYCEGLGIFERCNWWMNVMALSVQVKANLG